MKKIISTIVLFLLHSNIYAVYSSNINPDDIDLTGNGWFILIEHELDSVWTDSYIKGNISKFRNANPYLGVESFIDIPPTTKKKERRAIVSQVRNAWYLRKFFIPAHFSGKSAVINIGRSFWTNDVWFNEKKIGSFTGGLCTQGVSC